MCFGGNIERIHTARHGDHNYAVSCADRLTVPPRPDHCRLLFSKRSLRSAASLWGMAIVRSPLFKAEPRTTPVFQGSSDPTHGIRRTVPMLTLRSCDKGSLHPSVNRTASIWAAAFRRSIPVAGSSHFPHSYPARLPRAALPGI